MKTPRQAGFRWPAEWEPQRATWLAWPHNESDWPGMFAVIEWVFCEMIRGLSEHEQVGLIVASEAMGEAARYALAQVGVAAERVELLVAATDRSWTRDFLPTWLVREGGPEGAPRLGAVKWQFNGWARYPDHARDEAAGQRVAAARTEQRWV